MHGARKRLKRVKLRIRHEYRNMTRTLAMVSNGDPEKLIRMKWRRLWCLELLREVPFPPLDAHGRKALFALLPPLPAVCTNMGRACRGIPALLHWKSPRPWL